MRQSDSPSACSTQYYDASPTPEFDNTISSVSTPPLLSESVNAAPTYQQVFGEFHYKGMYNICEVDSDQSEKG